jgi:hypothetical protein
LKRWVSLSFRRRWRRTRAFQQGVNFATGGATALDRTFFVDRGLKAVSSFNMSLSFQLGHSELQTRK